MRHDIIIKCIFLLILIVACIGLLIRLKLRYRKVKVQCIKSLRLGISTPLYKDIVTDIDSGENIKVISTTRGQPEESYFVYRPNGRGNSYRTRIKGFLYFMIALLVICLLLTIIRAYIA